MKKIVFDLKINIITLFHNQSINYMKQLDNVNVIYGEGGWMTG